ncbi:YigZ family protein [Enterococcus sp. LJL98]
MLASYRTISQNGQVEIEIKKSRFICFLQRVKTEEEARDFIQTIKKEHWKANHNCSAFIIGTDGHVLRSSDDGEPSGTAGVPMLEVLKQNALVDVVAVVTRYFGGVKLGAGGLIRAYSSCVSAAVKEIGIVDVKPQQEIFVSIDYALLGKMQHFLEHNHYHIKETVFTDSVNLCVMVDQANSEPFKNEVIEHLNNQVTFQEGNVLPIEMPVID